MLRRKKRSIEEASPQVSRRKKKTESASLSKDKKTMLSKDQPDPVVIILPKRNPTGRSNVPLNIPSPPIPRTRKRKSETAPTNKDKKVKLSQKIQKEKIMKNFCWVCHKPCQVQICACSRVYHSECLIKASKRFDGNTCPECQLKSVNGTELTRPLSEGLKVYLECAANWITEKYKNEVFMSWPQSPGNNKIVPVIDIKTLMKKVQNNAYKTTSEFYSDVKWIYHSTCILYGEKSRETLEAKKLIKDVKEELIDLEACPECYYHLYCKLFTGTGDCDEDSDTNKNLNYENSFVRLCNPPHDIVWAKVSGYSHWPAKCLKVVNGKAHVRFFGKHEKSDIPINTIFHISEMHPVYGNRNITDTETRTSLEYTYGKREFLRYKALYEKNIGEFRFFKFREFYNTENVNFHSAKNLEHQKEITHKRSQLELPSSTNSTSEPCISVATVVAVDHPEIALSNNFSNDISVSMTFSVDSCEVEENANNVDTTSTNIEPSTNFSEQSLSESNLNCSSISIEASSEIQVKKEFNNSEQTQQILSVIEPSDPASSQFMQILMNTINNPSESFNIGGNSNASDMLANVLLKCISPTSTDETHLPFMPLPNTTVVKEEDNSCPTDSVSSSWQIHELEENTSENAAGCSLVADDSDQQNSEEEIAPCSSNKEIAVIDLTSDDDDIDSSTALSKILMENPQMGNLFQRAHQSLHALLTRLCIETCKQQKTDSRLRCEAFNSRLNATERRFQEETVSLRNEIKDLRMSLASEKKKNNQVLK